MHFIRWPLAAAIAVHSAAWAQGMSPGQGVAPLKYESAFAGYQAYREEKRATWRDVNDTMAVLGGHNAHLREIEAAVTTAGTVLEIDRAAGRVRIDGDAVRALGWPAGIAFWPLQSPALADQVRPGERVAFTLEKDGDAYLCNCKHTCKAPMCDGTHRKFKSDQTHASLIRLFVPPRHPR